jgi:hypothetical protein
MRDRVLMHSLEDRYAVPIDWQIFIAAVMNRSKDFLNQISIKAMAFKSI